MPLREKTTENRGNSFFEMPAFISRKSFPEQAEASIPGNPSSGLKVRPRKALAFRPVSRSISGCGL